MHMLTSRQRGLPERERSRSGFTLIELLVVIAIIGLLSSVVLASLNGARSRGRDARRVADLKQIQVALELYYSQNTFYPTVTSALAPSFIAVVPKDPSSGSAAYGYNPGGSPAQTYCLGATIEGTPPAGSAACTTNV